MKLQRAFLVAAVLLTAIVGAGCMSPEEDPADTVQETETTPGDTVEAGATPTEVTATPTVFGTTTGEQAQNATDGGGGDATTTTTEGEGEEGSG